MSTPSFLRHLLCLAWHLRLLISLLSHWPLLPSPGVCVWGGLSFLCTSGVPWSPPLHLPHDLWVVSAAPMASVTTSTLMSSKSALPAPVSCFIPMVCPVSHSPLQLNTVQNGTHHAQHVLLHWASCHSSLMATSSIQCPQQKCEPFSLLIAPTSTLITKSYFPKLRPGHPLLFSAVTIFSLSPEYCGAFSLLCSVRFTSSIPHPHCLSGGPETQS